METIENKLTGAWQRERRYVHLRGVASLVPWLVGLFLFDFVADWFLELSGLARFFLVLANLGFLGWLGYRYWLRYLRPYDATRVALQVERLYPNMHNLLVSFVQLDSQNPKQHGAPQLIEEVKRQAVKVAQPLSFTGIVDFTNLRKLLAAAATVLLLFGVSSVFAGEYYGTLLVRLLNPFTERGYPTRTLIHDVTGPVVVREGDRIELSAKAGGEVPEQGELRVKYGKGGWEKIRLDGKENVFTFEESKAARGFTYYFRIGDAKSKEYDVEVVTPPRILAAKVELTFPAYTNQEKRTEDSLQMPPVTDGTAVRWKLRLDQPLKEGHLVLRREGNPKLPFEIDPEDARNVTVNVKDTADLLAQGVELRKSEVVSYSFQWTEKKHGFAFEDNTRYTLEIMPDLPPVVTLLVPAPRSAQDQYLITARKNLTLIFEATDDFGLGQASIAYRLIADSERKLFPLPSFKGETRGDTFQAAWAIKETVKELKEGDVLVCEVEVSDNRKGREGPNVGRSRSLRLQVVSEDEYQRYVEKERTAGLDRTKTALKDEIESKAKVKLLISNP